MNRFEASRLALARTGLDASESLDRALEKAVTLSSHTLDVARVGVWLFDDDASTMRCVCQFDARSNTIDSGAVLEASRWPAYLEALHSRKCVVANDARGDAPTHELAAEYLTPLGITSMLDAPIFREGRVAGVVCHEHVDSPRTWSENDILFASSVSDMLTALFEYSGRLGAEALLNAERERRARDERMVALGRLAAGVAHDFNGILAATMLAADVFAREGSSPDMIACAGELKSGAEVGRRLISQLLTFAGRRIGSPEVLDASEVLAEMVPMLETLATHRSYIAFEIQPTPLRVFIDRSQLEQIFMNLVLNALDVTPTNKRVQVGLAAEQERQPCVEIRVADEGPGIAPEIRERIFEPFFGTRAGHGMGLATVYSIVQQAHGTVEVFSEPEGGAMFVVRLPAVSGREGEGGNEGPAMSTTPSE